MLLKVKNFRSVEAQEVELAPITIVYGPNGAGKSTLLYALPTLKNIVLNPNQNPSGFFNYVFVSLGSFDAVVFDHKLQRLIELGITFQKDGSTLDYQVIIGEKNGEFRLTVIQKDKARVEMKLPVSFPYAANQQTQVNVTDRESSVAITWNGVTCQVQGSPPTEENQKLANHYASVLNSPIETLRKVGMVPLKRGFSKPHYSPIAASPLLITEEEVGTFLSNNRYLVPKISFYLEKILNRDFRLNFQPGTAIFTLDATDRSTGIACELVNEGFGVNQLVYFLAKCVQPDVEWVCIEEPEIHLHPTAVRTLARVLPQLVRDEEKRFVISTHSEQLIFSLLALVAENALKPTDLACYLVQKANKQTSFERQEINDKGQIKGGLSNFLQAELVDLKTILQSGE